MSGYGQKNAELAEKKIYLIGLVALILLAGVAVLYSNNVKTAGAVKKAELLSEYELLQPLPQATLIELSSNNKDRQALVSAKYSSEKAYAEIRTFYIEEAKEKGWIFLNEKKEHDWGQDLGGKAMYFRKGENILAIQYAGEKADYGWNVAVSLSWNLHAE